MRLAISKPTDQEESQEETQEETRVSTVSNDRRGCDESQHEPDTGGGAASIDPSGALPPGAHTPVTWWRSSFGRMLLTEENQLLASAVRRLHGDTLMWAGVSAGSAQLSVRCMVRRRLFMTPAPIATDQPIDGLRATLENIPLRNASLDGVVLHHALETCADPRTALREVARVLQPGGELIVCGMNRFAPLSLVRWLTPAPERFLNPARVADWLEVLGFEQTIERRFTLYRPPFAAETFDRPMWDGARAWLRARRVPLGNAFILQYRKKTLAVTPQWRPMRGKLVTAGYARFALAQKLAEGRRRERLPE
ncbi:MAG: methyltransferase domain-containing protein [Pseudomonadota bacterium]